MRLAVIVTLLAMVLFHAPILRAVGGLLIVDSAPSHPDVVLLLSGDGLYSHAAEAALAHPDLILLKPEFTKARLEEMGIWPDRIAEFHRELTRRGVPDTQRHVLAGPSRSEWDAIEKLNRWLAPGSTHEVLALCDEFQTRRLKLIVDSVLQTQASRVGIRPLSDRRFDASNWWKSRAGVRTVVLAAISLTTASFHRRGSPPPAAWDPDDFEQALMAEAEAEVDRAPVATNWLASIGRWLDIGQRPQKVDHVVLLPGDENVRPFVAAALIKAGLADDILLPQNFPSPAVQDGLSIPNHDVTATVLKRRGVDRDRLRVLDMKSDGTIDDARATQEVLDIEPDASVAVVTSFYHTRRARMAFRAIYGPRADRFIYVSAPVTDITADNWWESDVGTQMIVTELVKLAIYWVNYGPGIYWIPGALLAIVVVWRWRRAVRKRRRREAARAHPASTPTSA